ncbi:MAG: lysophospholipid acyltransferase family protein [Sulfitobacter sp.]
MNEPWNEAAHPDFPKISKTDWLRIILRGAALIILVSVGLIATLCLRLIERPVFGLNRPITPFITQFVCRGALRILGVRFSIKGQPMAGRGAVVANHSSWLDIFALNAAKRIYFVSKSEVANWPGIGWLARATGTVFIKRARKEAQAQTKLFQSRLLAGHKLLFFPEGTSTDGQQVIAFKTTLFQSFFAPELKEVLEIQPVAVIYHAPAGADPRFYGWWGDMELAPHLLVTLAPARQGAIDVVYCAPLKVADFEDRKSLAAACENAVRRAHNECLPKA